MLLVQLSLCARLNYKYLHLSLLFACLEQCKLGLKASVSLVARLVQVCSAFRGQQKEEGWGMIQFRAQILEKNVRHVYSEQFFTHREFQRESFKSDYKLPSCITRALRTYFGLNCASRVNNFLASNTYSINPYFDEI